MTEQRNEGGAGGFWMTFFLLVLLCVTIWFLREIGTIVGYFIAAGAIAYLLNPAVEGMTARGIPRSIAITITFIVFTGGIAIGVTLVIPPAVAQFNGLLEHLPQYLESVKGAWEKLVSLSKSYNIPLSVEQLPDKIGSDLQKFVMNAGKAIYQNVAGFFSTLATLVIVPILVFYFLKDGPRMRGAFTSYLPVGLRDDADRLITNVNRALGGFVRGQLKLCLAMGVLTWLSLALVPKMEYSIIFGIIAGITEVIPYLGPLLALIGPLIFATTISWQLVVTVLILFVVIQLVEGNVLAPRIMGKDVDMHPAFIILVLMSAGQVAGIVGMIVAIPVAVILRVFFDHFYVEKVVRPSEVAAAAAEAISENENDGAKEKDL